MDSLGGGAVKRPMWLYPKVLGFNPSERWGHSACYSDGIVYVFGGCCGGLHFSDVLTLDLETMIWSSLPISGERPGTRDSHSAVVVGQRMIVLGGTNGSKKINDLHILDLRAKKWSRPEVEGDPPSPRESHTATVVNGDKLVVFGGSGEGERNYLNDVHILDLKTMKWTSPQVDGDLPAPRDSHTAVAVENRLIVYGGDCGDRYLGEVDVLDMDTLTWSRLEVQGTSPGVRAGHATVNIGTKVYVIGGVGEKQYYNDVWLLDVQTCTWTQLDIRGQKPQGRFSHSAVVAHSDIAIYGGCGEDERPLNELLILQLGAEHPNGRYNVSMCKIFGNQWIQQKRRFLRGAENSNTDHGCRDKKMVSGAELLGEESNRRTGEAEAESMHSLMRSSENLRSKKRKLIDSKAWELESEQEEHSHSLSQHSSPSQSDQEQSTVQKLSATATDSSTAFQPFGLFKHLNQNHSQSNGVLSNQNHQRESLRRNTQNNIFMAKELQRHSKPEPLIRVVQARRPETQQYMAGQKPQQRMASAGVVAIPNLIGSEVRGSIDGAFDSGYLMTANVNGQIFRGVLFNPGPGFVAKEAVLPQKLPPFGQIIVTQQPFQNPNYSNGATFASSPQLDAIVTPAKFVLPISGSCPPESRDNRNGLITSDPQGQSPDMQFRTRVGNGKIAVSEEKRVVHDPYLVRSVRMPESGNQVRQAQIPAVGASPTITKPARLSDLQGVVLTLGGPGIGPGGSKN